MNFAILMGSVPKSAAGGVGHRFQGAFLIARKFSLTRCIRIFGLSILTSLYLLLELLA